MRGLKQMDDYAKFVPGLSLGVREPGGTTIVFRGVALVRTRSSAPSLRPALYLDEQPITQSGRNPDPRLIDIERLEDAARAAGHRSTVRARSPERSASSPTSRIRPASTRWVEAQVHEHRRGRRRDTTRACMCQRAAGRRIASRCARRLHRGGRRVHRQRPRATARWDNCRPGNGTFYQRQPGRRGRQRVAHERRRARRCAGIVNDDVDVTLDCDWSRTSSAGGHGDVNPGVGDLNQVRFENESLEDNWYQLALTLNASTSFGDLMCLGLVLRS